MNIELSVLSNGVVMLVSDRPMPDMVRRVEYYRDQRLFMLVYDNAAVEDMMMHYEVPIDFAGPVERTPNVIIYSLYPDHDPIGYKVPLVKIGGVF